MLGALLLVGLNKHFPVWDLLLIVNDASAIQQVAPEAQEGRPSFECAPDICHLLPCWNMKYVYHNYPTIHQVPLRSAGSGWQCS